MEKLLFSNIGNQPKDDGQCTWKRDLVSGVIKSDGLGKHDHKNSFAVVDSHYCWAKTNKKYIEPGLNIHKTYDLCKCKCSNNGRCVLLLSLCFIAVLLITFSTFVFTVQNQIDSIAVRSIKSKSAKENTCFWRRKAISWHSFASKSPNGNWRRKSIKQKTRFWSYLT